MKIGVHSQDVTDGSVRGQPHWREGLDSEASHRVPKKLTLLQLELLNTGLIGGDGGTLDTDTVLLDSLGGINGDLVIGLVTVLKTLERGISRRARGNWRV